MILIPYLNFSISSVYIQIMIKYQKYLEAYEPGLKKQLSTFQQIFNQKLKWPLHSKKWSRLKCDKVFQESSEVLAEQIDLYTNNEPSILKFLTVPALPSLLCLTLNNNKIESVEFLQKIYMPELRVINFSDNHLTNIVSSFNKAFLPKLETLILYANNIVESEHRSQPLQLQGSSVNKKIVMGINYMVDFGALNKLQNPSSFGFLSLQNNKGKHHGRVDRWAISVCQILI